MALRFISSASQITARSEPRTKKQLRIVQFDRSSPALVKRYLEYKKPKMKNKPTASPLKAVIEPNQALLSRNYEISQNKPERLSKHLSDLGVFSRNQAEEIVRSGIFYIDGKQITDPSMVIVHNSSMQIKFPPRFNVPLPNNVKLWLYHKPAATTVRSPKIKKSVIE